MVIKHASRLKFTDEPAPQVEAPAGAAGHTNAIPIAFETPVHDPPTSMVMSTPVATECATPQQTNRSASGPDHTLPKRKRLTPAEATIERAVQRNKSSDGQTTADYEELCAASATVFKKRLSRRGKNVT